MSKELVKYFSYGAFVYCDGNRREDREDMQPFSEQEAGAEPIFFDCHAVLGDGDIRICAIGIDRLYIIQRSVFPQTIFSVWLVDVSKYPMGEKSPIRISFPSVLSLDISRTQELVTDIFLSQRIEGKTHNWTCAVGYEYGSGWSDNGESH